MKFLVFTLFPEMFPGPLGFSLADKARKKGIWDLLVCPIRDFALEPHGTVDDAPYGGGTGLVMRPDVLHQALSSFCYHPNFVDKTLFVYLSPRGKPLVQCDLHYYTQTYETLVLLCGRYEGVDQRLLEAWNFQEISMGDYVLAGGEIPALALMEGCIRLLPGVMSNDEGILEESFSQGLLEYNQYTRPAIWNGHKVPDILLSGHHQGVQQWRQKCSEELTQRVRPDLWAAYLKKK